MRCNCLITLVACALLSGAGSSASAALVGHWNFEGVVGTNVPDKSGNGLDGTIVDGAGGHVPGSATPKDTSASVVYDAVRGSNVLNLQNPAPYTETFEQCCGSYVRVGNDPLLQITGDLTIAMWVSHRSSYWFETVLAAKGWDYGILEYAGNNGFTSVFLGNSANATYWMNPPGSNYGTNEWHHVALTYDSATGERKLYFDGLLDVTDTLWAAGTTLAATSADFLIGSSGGGNGTAGLGRSWDGLIDDVRIYNEALSLSEIGAIMSVPEPGTILLALMAAAFAGGRRRSKLPTVGSHSA